MAFLQRINTVHANLTFTQEPPRTSVNFLDAAVSFNSDGKS